MRLVNAKTGAEVNRGDKVINFRDEPAILKGWVKPKHSGSTGRVVVSHHGDEMHHEYYPSVYGLKWVEQSG